MKMVGKSLVMIEATWAYNYESSYVTSAISSNILKQEKVKFFLIPHILQTSRSCCLLLFLFPKLLVKNNGQDRQ
jgi:hypothetical protein